MVSGFTKFKERFQGFENQYVIIGGTACDLIIWCKSILGNLKAALYSCIFSGDFDRNGCWWTDLYCISIVDHRRNHCTYII